MNVKKNRIVFFITFCICIFFYFISDISFINEQGLVLGIFFDIFLMLFLSMIVMLGYAFLTFNRDDHSIFMDNLEETLQENYRKELEKDNSSNTGDEESEEESAHPFMKWLEGFGDRLDFVARLMLYVPLVVIGAGMLWSDASNLNSELPHFFYGFIGAVIGFIVAYIIHKIILLCINFLLWIITGK